MDHLTDLEMRLIFHHIPHFTSTFFREDLAIFKKHNELRNTHVYAIMFLKINGPSPMSKVAQFLGLEKGSFTPIANRLINWGYIVRENDSFDKRKSLLVLTDSGREFAIEVRSARSHKFSDQVEKLSSAERKQFFSSLQRLQDLLESINGHSFTCSPSKHPRSSEACGLDNKGVHKHD